MQFVCICIERKRQRRRSQLEMSNTSPGENVVWEPGDAPNNNPYDILRTADEYPPLKRKKDKQRMKPITESFVNLPKINPVINGPRYLVLSRNETQPELTMHTVSPFTIHTTIEQSAGKNIEVKRLRNGTFLIKTANMRQADQLKRLTVLSGNVKVKIVDHERLNSSKGVIFCPDFEYVTDDEIKTNTKNENVIDVRRITRKVNGEVRNTHLFVFTFDSPILPKEIKAAYLNLPVRPFIPQPLRCYKCQQFGHFTLKCRSKVNICGICTEIVVDPSIEKKCLKPAKCVNCNDAHPSFSKLCPKYKTEYAIQKIKVEKSISYVQARTEHNSNLLIPVAFSAIVRNDKTPPMRTTKPSASSPLEATSALTTTVNITENQNDTSEKEQQNKNFNSNTSQKKVTSTNTNKNNTTKSNEISNVMENNNVIKTDEMETNTEFKSSTNQITHKTTHSNQLLQQANKKSENEILTLIASKELPDEPLSERREHTVSAELHQTDEIMQYDEID